LTRESLGIVTAIIWCGVDLASRILYSPITQSEVDSLAVEYASCMSTLAVSVYRPKLATDYHAKDDVADVASLTTLVGLRNRTNDYVTVV